MAAWGCDIRWTRTILPFFVDPSCLVYLQYEYSKVVRRNSDLGGVGTRSNRGGCSDLDPRVDLANNRYRTPKALQISVCAANGRTRPSLCPPNGWERTSYKFTGRQKNASPGKMTQSQHHTNQAKRQQQKNAQKRNKGEQKSKKTTRTRRVRNEKKTEKKGTRYTHLLPEARAARSQLSPLACPAASHLGLDHVGRGQRG